MARPSSVQDLTPVDVTLNSVSGDVSASCCRTTVTVAPVSGAVTCMVDLPFGVTFFVPLVAFVRRMVGLSTDLTFGLGSLGVSSGQPFSLLARPLAFSTSIGFSILIPALPLVCLSAMLAHRGFIPFGAFTLAP